LGLRPKTPFYLIYFLLTLKESSKEKAPKNPTEGLCIPQARPNKGTKSFGSHIFGSCQRTKTDFHYTPFRGCSGQLQGGGRVAKFSEADGKPILQNPPSGGQGCEHKEAIDLIFPPNSYVFHHNSSNSLVSKISPRQGGAGSPFEGGVASRQLVDGRGG
jgi:hypothetical protein